MHLAVDARARRRRPRRRAGRWRCRRSESPCRAPWRSSRRTSPRAAERPPRRIAGRKPVRNAHDTRVSCAHGTGLRRDGGIERGQPGQRAAGSARTACVSPTFFAAYCARSAARKRSCGRSPRIADRRRHPAGDAGAPGQSRTAAQAASAVATTASTEWSGTSTLNSSPPTRATRLPSRARSAGQGCARRQ